MRKGSHIWRGGGGGREWKQGDVSGSCDQRVSARFLSPGFLCFPFLNSQKQNPVYSFGYIYSSHFLSSKCHVLASLLVSFTCTLSLIMYLPPPPSLLFYFISCFLLFPSGFLSSRILPPSALFSFPCLVLATSPRFLPLMISLITHIFLILFLLLCFLLFLIYSSFYMPSFNFLSSHFILYSLLSLCFCPFINYLFHFASSPLISSFLNSPTYLLFNSFPNCTLLPFHFIHVPSHFDSSPLLYFHLVPYILLYFPLFI